MASTDEQSDVFLSSDAMSDEFFTDIVEKKLKIARDKFKLRLVLISPAAGKNENFVCVVYRAKVKIQLLETNEKVSVDIIIKALVSTLKEFKEFGVFPRERFMYENILKSFEDIWSERGGKEIQFAPKSIKFETDPYELIVMDDLKAMEYAMLDRKIGADFAQTKIMLSKLAKFHAASSIRYQKVS
jgi:Ecdysteroid kinase-like family